MNLWNVKNLPIPPIDTYKALDTNIDINHLKKIFEDGITFFGNEHHMSAEHAVLSRIVYRTKQKFRPAKDFKALQKVHKALENYFKTDIASDLQSFIDLIPSRYTDETYLPNKNILHYILVRLQGIVKLMERIVETCKITAYLFEKRLHTGHFWKLGFIIYSMVSRIYVLAKYNAKFICEFYGKVLPFSSQLRNSGRNWLPENYILPYDLQKWINVTWLDIDDELQIIEPSELPQITKIFDLADDDDDIQFCDEYVMVDDEDDVEVFNNFKKVNSSDIKPDMIALRGFDMDEEVGEVIDIKDNSLCPDENGHFETDKENICNTLFHHKTEDNNINVHEVIEVNDSEIITVDSTLNDSDSDDNEVCEVINLDNSCDVVNKNRIDESDTSQIVSLLDDSLPSELQNTDSFISSSPMSFHCIKLNALTDLKDGDNVNLNKKIKNKNQKKRDKFVIKKSKIKNINKSKTKRKETSKTLAESDTENVIIVSDSSLLPDDTTDKILHRKKLKRKTNKNINNFSNSILGKNKKLVSLNSHILANTNEGDLDGKEKKKKTKKKFKMDQPNPADPKQTHSDFKYNSRMKRKIENNAESSSKKMKSIHSTTKKLILSDKTNRKKKKINKKENLCVLDSKHNNKSNTREPKLNSINSNGVHNRKDKSKKAKKKKNKLLKNVQIAHKSGNLKHIVKEVHYNTHDLKTKHNSRKKKKNRYFK